MNYVLYVLIILPPILSLIIYRKLIRILKKSYPDFWNKNKYLRFGINGFIFLFLFSFK